MEVPYPLQMTICHNCSHLSNCSWRFSTLLFNENCSIAIKTNGVFVKKRCVQNKNWKRKHQPEIISSLSEKSHNKSPPFWLLFHSSFLFFFFFLSFITWQEIKQNCTDRASEDREAETTTMLVVCCLRDGQKVEDKSASSLLIISVCVFDCMRGRCLRGCSQSSALLLSQTTAEENPTSMPPPFVHPESVTSRLKKIKLGWKELVSDTMLSHSTKPNLQDFMSFLWEIQHFVSTYR